MQFGERVFVDEFMVDDAFGLVKCGGNFCVDIFVGF